MPMPRAISLAAGAKAAHLLGPAHVRSVIADRHSSLKGKVGVDFFGRRGVAETVEHDAATFPRQGPGDPETDAAGGAGDECGFVLQRIFRRMACSRSVCGLRMSHSTRSTPMTGMMLPAIKTGLNE